MTELVKTILLLSMFGFIVTAILLCLKPITSKRFPACWQYCAWILALILMLVPVYKLIPAREVPKLPLTISVVPKTVPSELPTVTTPDDAPREMGPARQLPSLLEVVSIIWLIGFVVFLSVVAVNYLLFVRRKKKGSVELFDTPLLEEIKGQLHLKGRIRIKMSPAVQSPLLVGVFRPIVYLPCRELSDEHLRMVFLHELTHYKRKDLLVKWLSVFVNAVHWFNPLAYLLTANISESCEVSCDMTVTRNMSEDERTTYMKTILYLLEQKEAS